MIYSIVILFILAVTILIRKYTSHRTLFITLMLIFLDVTIFSIVLYISKCGNYPYPNSRIMTWDYRGYVLLSKLKIPFYNIIRMQNIGFAGFLICMPFIFPDLGVNRKLRWLDFLCLAIPVGYAVFFDPEVRINMLFFLYMQSVDKFDMYRNLFMNLGTAWGVALAFYMLLPLVRLLHAYFNSSLIVKKKQLAALIISLAFLDAICIFIFLQNPFIHVFDDINVSSMLGFQEGYIAVLNNHYYYIWLPAIVLVASNVMLFALMKLSVLDDFDILHNHIIRRNTRDANKNIQSIFHSFKNIMFSVNVIAKQMEMETAPEQQNMHIERLKALSESYIEHMNTVLKVYKDSKVNTAENDVTECIERAISRVHRDNNISISKNYGVGVFAICDAYVLDEIFVNIIENAVDAINLAGREQGYIDISVSEEYEWVAIKITDNGIGIPKKQINKVFKAFYTTKGTNKNWGVGMNYVMKSIKAMKGIVYIQSKVDEYTTVNILLQRVRRGLYGKNKSSNCG